ncbi:hypothetical protein [Cellulomonas fimi]|uniref:hypothetical protein n=1 Tax=Cellulomonas fimi TaxID=1708 RepID=UPI0037BEFDB3
MNRSAPPFADRPVVEATHVTRRFDGTVALDDVSLAVRQGELVGLLGPTARARRRSSAWSPASASPTRARCASSAVTVLITSHFLEEIEPLAERVVVIDRFD